MAVNTSVRGQRVELLGYSAQKLWLSIWADARLELLERHTAAIDSDKRCGDVRYEIR